MFGFNNMLGVIVDKNYLTKVSDKEKEVFKIYIKICEAIVEKDIKTLQQDIPEMRIKNILNDSKSKKEWIKDIEKENIKYYGIELLNTEINITKDNATIKSKSKIRAKLFEYRGSWIKTTYMDFIKENDKWIITDFCI